MSYSNLILSDRPMSYWSEPQLSRVNNGYEYSLYDLQSGNDAKLVSYSHTVNKPIVFNGSPSTKLNDVSYIEIDNVNHYFARGRESRDFSMDFWFSIIKNPSFRHELFFIENVARCYLEKDRVYLKSEINSDIVSIRLDNWSSQHYVNFYYSNGKAGLYLDDLDEISIVLGEPFIFSDQTPSSIIFGPGSSNYNMLVNNTEWDISNGTISYISSDYYSGGSCIEVSKSGTLPAAVKYYERVAISPYEEYSVSSYVKIPASNENSSLELNINVYDEFGNLIQNFTDSANLSSNDGWVRLKKTFYSTTTVEEIEIEIREVSAGTSGQKFLVDSVLLEKNIEVSNWDENYFRSDPLFISGIAFYPFKLSNSQRTRRVLHGFYDEPNGSSIEKGGNVLNLSYNSQIKNIEYHPTQINNVQNITLNNLTQFESRISQIITEPEEVFIGDIGGSYNLDRYGISFNGDAYIKLSNVSRYFNPRSSTISFQIDIDDQSGDGNILFISPVLGSDGLILHKKNNKICLSTIIDESQTLILESSTINSSSKNVLLTFNENFATLKIESEEITEEIPTIQSPTEVYFGNIPETVNPIKDKIRNLSFRELTLPENINWDQPGLYTLRFNNSLNVSQHSSFNATLDFPATGNNSVIFYNNNSENLLYVNEILIKENSYIPQFNYNNPQPLQIRGEAITENSLLDVKSFSNLTLCVYNSESIDSNLGQYRIESRSFLGDEYIDEYFDEYGGFERNPYVINTNNNNLISLSENVGIKFVSGESTGSKISTVFGTYKSIEFILKLNRYPNNNENYTVFDAGTAGSLYLSDNGFSSQGQYEIFIDGSLMQDISTFSPAFDQIYHIFIVFSTDHSNDIFIGTDAQDQNGMDGSLGNIIVYPSIPTNYANFIYVRYEDLMGINKLSISDGNIEIKDSDVESQTYFFNNSRDYYKMELLPKVKIMSDS